MFSLAAAFVALAASAFAAPAPQGSVASGPISVSSGGPSSISVPGGSSVSSLSGVSLSSWGNLPGLSGFDSFYGSNNFCGNNNQQVVLQQTVSCQSEAIVEVQQQFAILQEFAKRVLLEKVCEVETQTIVWSQYISSLQSFSSDFSHVSGRSIGYDSVIASHISDLVDSSDNIITTNYGFQGLDIGSNLICPEASSYNWQSGVSQISVQAAQFVSQSAIIASHSSSVSSLSFGSQGSAFGTSGLGFQAGTSLVGSV